MSHIVMWEDTAVVVVGGVQGNTQHNTNQLPNYIN